MSLLCSHSSSLECRYWDEEQLAWSTEGCATVLYNGTDGAGGGAAASGGFVGCECTHLSDFVAVKVRANPNPGPGPGPDPSFVAGKVRRACTAEPLASAKHDMALAPAQVPTTAYGDLRFGTIDAASLVTTNVDCTQGGVWLTLYKENASAPQARPAPLFMPRPAIQPRRTHPAAFHPHPPTAACFDT